MVEAQPGASYRVLSICFIKFTAIQTPDQTLKHSSSKHQYQKYSWEVQFNNSDLLVQHVADSWQHWPATQSTHALNRATFTLIVKQLRFTKIRPAFSCHEQEN